MAIHMQLPGVLSVTYLSRSIHTIEGVFSGLSASYDPSFVGVRKILLAVQSALVTEEWKAGDLSALSAVKLVTQSDLLSASDKNYLCLRRNLGLSFLPAMVVICLSFLPTTMLPFLGFKVFPGISLSVLLMLIFATPVQFLSAHPFHKHGFLNLLKGILTVDLLVSLTVSFCYFYSVFSIVFALVRGDPAAPRLLQETPQLGPQYLNQGFVPPPHFAPNPPAFQAGSGIPAYSNSASYFAPPSGALAQALTGPPAAPHEVYEVPTAAVAPIVAAAAPPIVAAAAPPIVAAAVPPIVAAGANAAHVVMTSDSESGELPHFFETASAIVLVVILGRLLEHRTRRTACKHITDLEKSCNTICEVVSKPNETLHPVILRTCPVEALSLGDHIRILEGHIIPVDGVKANDGVVTLDEAVLRGESQSPVTKSEGDKVLAGSYVTMGALIVRVERIGHSSSLGRLLSIVDSASCSRSSYTRTAIVMARWILPVTLVCAFLVLSWWNVIVFSGRLDVVWPWRPFFNRVLIYPSQLARVMFAARFGLGVLAVAAPCAMGFALSVGAMSAISSAVSAGALVRGVASLEKLNEVDTVILSKTGALTTRNPSVKSVALSGRSLEAVASAIHESAYGQRRDVQEEELFGHSLQQLKHLSSQDFFNLEFATLTPQWCDFELPNPDLHEAMVWKLLASIEGASCHPLAEVLFKSALDKLVVSDVFPMKQCVHLPGAGLQGIFVVPSAQEPDVHIDVGISVGSWRFISAQLSDEEREKDSYEALQQFVFSEQAKSRAVVGLSLTVLTATPVNVPVACFALEEYLKPKTSTVVSTLQSSFGLGVFLCSGDSTLTTQSTASSVGIPLTHVRPELNPYEKAQFIRSMQSSGKVVLMVGDNDHDSKALRQADVGLVIGSQGELGLKSADILLLRDRLESIPSLFSLAQLSVSNFRTTVLWSIVYVVVTLPVAMGVLYPFFYLPPSLGSLVATVFTFVLAQHSLSLRTKVSVMTHIRRRCRLCFQFLSRGKASAPQNLDSVVSTPFTLGDDQLDEYLDDIDIAV
ncbi:MAG: hypothetical protein KVP17_000172 [Porospora cf. gigantea B]|uniref:uncharacterized protein n=1 Tax=Porospora cf. gigantea B TaxID=2853592 RepID=UPI003571852E|nr:MAG: hypothetical protein KVP17_000172 [Porospora cf. gigantea B]